MVSQQISVWIIIIILTTSMEHREGSEGDCRLLKRQSWWEESHACFQLHLMYLFISTSTHAQLALPQAVPLLSDRV